MSELAVMSALRVVPACGTVVPPAPEPCWYAVHTRSNFEKRVASELGRKAVEHYWPAFVEKHQWKDRRKRVDVPLFPGYLFVRFADSPQTRLRVLSTNGVVRVLGFGSGVEPVPDAEVEGIRRLLASCAPRFAHPFLKEGARVRIRRGPLKDIEGLLIRVKNSPRLVLSVTILSQSVATEIDMADVELLGPSLSRSESLP